MTGFAGEQRGHNIVLKQPFCRGLELADIISAIRAEDCRAVFVTSDSGLGASTILRKLTSVARKHVPVLTVHGSQSLAKIPFGVLAPILPGQQSSSGDVRLDVLRLMLAEIDRLQQALDGEQAQSHDLPLIIIDDAHLIDEGTAELVVSLVMAGAANVVLSHSSRHGLPTPLPTLWVKGIAENIVLMPLTREQGHAFCELMLDGPVLPATSWHYWSTAAGNPLFLHLLVSEAVNQGLLLQHGGTWMGEPAEHKHSHGLEDAVRVALRGLSVEGKEALNLVALSEPLPESALRELVGAEPVQELLDWPLVGHHPPKSGHLVLVNPIYGQVIREMVPVTQSRRLHEQLIGEFKNDDTNKESLLRRVLWAVEVGVPVDGKTMLRAALLASKMFRSTTALELAAHVRGNQFKFRADMVRARARYNLGDYHGAFVLMGSVRQSALGLDDMLFGALLYASTKSALGMPVESLFTDAKELQEYGERLAGEDPENAESIRAQAQSSARMVELVALSRAGKYSEMTALTTVLSATQEHATASDKLSMAMALTMDSERLTAQGLPEQGTRRAVEAFSIEHSEENDVFFLPESILLRQLTALLCAGDWSGAAGIMEHFSLESGPIVFTFGGGANVVRGMILLRAGRHSESYEALCGGLESLRLNDPQQLLGYCTAMAAYAAARLGLSETAGALLHDHVESTGIFVVVAHERAYLAAARHILAPDGGWLADLLAQADNAHVEGTVMFELNALVLAMELGDDTVAQRVTRVAAGVEGPWARDIAGYAAALYTQEGHTLAAEGERLKTAGLLGFAQLALTKSASLLGGSGLRNQAHAVLKNLRHLTASLGTGVESGGSEPPAPLTNREREVAELAASGLSDKEIADKLTLARRTVEGHLYRAYTKLGISTREELAQVL